MTKPIFAIDIFSEIEWSVGDIFHYTHSTGRDSIQRFWVARSVAINVVRPPVFELTQNERRQINPLAMRTSKEVYEDGVSF